MTMYLVRDPQTKAPVWLAWVDTANVRVYTWIPNLDRFVLNGPLTEDFYHENEMSYEVVDSDGARAAIRDRLGLVDRRSRQWLVDRFAAVPFQRTADEILAAATPGQLSPRQQAIALATRVQEARPGEWITWKMPTTCATGG